MWSFERSTCQVTVGQHFQCRGTRSNFFRRTTDPCIQTYFQTFFRKMPTLELFYKDPGPLLSHSAADGCLTRCLVIIQRKLLSQFRNSNGRSFAKSNITQHKALLRWSMARKMFTLIFSPAITKVLCHFSFILKFQDSHQVFSQQNLFFLFSCRSLG